MKLVVFGRWDKLELNQMRISELQNGQKFLIEGMKTPHGFITLEDGLTHYGLDPDTIVSVQQGVRPSPLTIFGMRVEIANWLKPGQLFIPPPSMRR